MKIASIPRMTSAALAFLCLAAALNADELEGWMEVRSPNYTVVGNRSAKELRRIAYELESARAILMRLSSTFRLDPKRRFIVIAPKDRRSAGLFLTEEESATRHVAIRLHFGPESHFVLIGPGAWIGGERNLAFHAVAGQAVALNYEPLPFWLRVSLFSVLGWSLQEEKRVILGAGSESTRESLRVTREFPLEKIFSAQPDDPRMENVGEAYRFNTQCWLFGHYLFFAEGVGPQKKLETIVDSIHDGADPKDAVQQALVELPELEKRLLNYARLREKRAIPFALPPPVRLEDFPVSPLSTAEVATLSGEYHLQAALTGKDWRWTGKVLQTALSVSAAMDSEASRRAQTGARPWETIARFGSNSGDTKAARASLERAIAWIQNP